MKVYDKIFDWYVTARNPTAGVEAVREFSRNLPPKAKILDIGCGHGLPITHTLHELGFQLYGIDSSPKMMSKFSENFPDRPAQCSNVLHSDFFNTRFDAIIAYGLLVHLPQDQQTKVIEKVSEHLQCGGCFLFNSGDEDGKRMTPPGYNGGERFMSYSMSSFNYKKTLHNNEMRLQIHYIEKDTGGTIYIAKKVSKQDLPTNDRSHLAQ